MAEYLGWHQSLGAVPTIARLQESAEAMRAEVGPTPLPHTHALTHTPRVCSEIE